MKLTQEQIRDALKMLPVTPNTAECWVWPRTAAVEALDAYQRVEALLKRWESVNAVPGKPDATVWGWAAAELRRALYGGGVA